MKENLKFFEQLEPVSYVLEDLVSRGEKELPYLEKGEPYPLSGRRADLKKAELSFSRLLKEAPEALAVHWEILTWELRRNLYLIATGERDQGNWNVETRLDVGTLMTLPRRLLEDEKLKGAIRNWQTECAARAGRTNNQPVIISWSRDDPWKVWRVSERMLSIPRCVLENSDAALSQEDVWEEPVDEVTLETAVVLHQGGMKLREAFMAAKALET